MPSPTLICSFRVGFVVISLLLWELFRAGEQMTDRIFPFDSVFSWDHLQPTCEPFLSQLLHSTEIFHQQCKCTVRNLFHVFITQNTYPHCIKRLLLVRWLLSMMNSLVLARCSCWHTCFTINATVPWRTAADKSVQQVATGAAISARTASALVDIWITTESRLVMFPYDSHLSSSALYE